MRACHSWEKRQRYCHRSGDGAYLMSHGHRPAPLNEFLGFGGMRRAPVAGTAGRSVVAVLSTTGPRNAGKAHLYALNKIPGAESACDTKAEKSCKSTKC